MSTVSFGQDRPHRAGCLWAQTATGPRFRSAPGSLRPHRVRQEQSRRLAVNCSVRSPAQGPQKRPRDKPVSDLSVHLGQLEVRENAGSGSVSQSQSQSRRCRLRHELQATLLVQGPRPRRKGPQCTLQAICNNHLLQPARFKCKFQAAPLVSGTRIQPRTPRIRPGGGHSGWFFGALAVLSLWPWEAGLDGVDWTNASFQGHSESRTKPAAENRPPGAWRPRPPGELGARGPPLLL